MIPTYCIQLRSGGYFHYPIINGDINLDDIAYSLSHLVRYNGHADPQWSVANHSLLVADLVDKEFRLYALLHDAAEAYIGDIPGPLLLEPEFAPVRKYKKKLETTILNYFGLGDTLPAEVKLADMQALAIEKEVVLGDEGRRTEWECLADIPKHPHHEGMKRRLAFDACHSTPWIAEGNFIHEVERLLK